MESLKNKEINKTIEITRYRITLHLKLIAQRRIILASILLFFSHNIFAQQNFNELSRINKSQCLGLTTQHPSYSKAIGRILNLNEVNKWQKKMGVNRKIALIPAMNTPEFFKENCFWSIGIYENAKDRLTLWKSFLVPVDESKIYYLSPSDGEYHPYLIN